MGVEQRENSHQEKKEFWYLKPETLLSTSEKEWLKSASIAHLSPLWLEKPRDTRRYGGAEDVVMNILNGLVQFQVKDQELFGNPKDKVLERRLPNLHVHYPPYSEFRTADLYEILMSDPPKAKDLERQYVFFSYQTISNFSHWLTLVHDHTNYGKDLAYWVSDNLPIVRTEHGPILPPDNSALDAAHLEFFRQAKNLWFIAISESQYLQMPDLPWIGIVHNGIDPADFDFSAEKRGNYLLFMGRIAPAKAPHRAIEVAKALDMPLIIAGHIERNQESEAYFKNKIKPELNNKIHYIPGVGKEVRRQLYRDAKCLLVLGEWQEPFGLITAEAAMSGTPVVGFNRGAIPEIVENGKTGFIVDTLDSAIDATAEILNKGKIDPLECRKRAELHFSLPVMTAKLVKIYQEAEARFNGESHKTGLVDFDNIKIDEGASQS